MDCCKSGGSPRKALISQFQHFLDHVEESSDRCADEGRGASQVYESQTRGIPEEYKCKLPHYPDYKDPSKRPLIANVQVLEYRPTGKKQLLDLKIPDITGVEYCEIKDFKPEKLPSPPPGLIDKILANKELGYPAPGEKSPSLYRTPRPIPQDPPPRYPPPSPMDHRAGIPCEICEPPIQSGSMKKCPSVARIDTTRDECALDDPHCHVTYGKVNERQEQRMNAPTSMARPARMRPDPATSRTIEISTAHMCPPGYSEGARVVRRPATASAPGEPSKACPESCTDILADQERRSRERRQLEALPGDLKIGEPKICPPGYPAEYRAQPGGMHPKEPKYGGMKAKMCQPKFPMGQTQYKQGGMGARDPKLCPHGPPGHVHEQSGMGGRDPKVCSHGHAHEQPGMCGRDSKLCPHGPPGHVHEQPGMGGRDSKLCPHGHPHEQPGMALGGTHPPMTMSGAHQGMASAEMCPPKFSVGISPDSSIGQDPRCAVDYQKCAPKKRPGVCGPSEGHPLGGREKTKSRELIGGVLLTGCDCVKRNGLQHDCKRTLCQGRPECLTNPPMCLPSGGPGCIPASYFES